MKSKTFFLWLFNPFTYIAGGKALIIGLCIQLLTVFIGNMTGSHFDGAIDLHVGGKTTLLNDFYMWGISVITLILVLYISGLILIKNFRFIDLAGTVLLSRTPYFFLVILAFFVEFPTKEAILTDPFSILLNIPFLIFASLSFFVLIWTVILLFNAYKISTGLTTSKAVVSLIIAIIIAEVISKILIYFMMK